jgi:5,6-dimethylbenzimidazole synthase
MFCEAEKKGVYRAIYNRRDIRSEFLPKRISKQILMKLLKAAHHAGSVGFMQPWNFIVINDRKIKEKVKQIFEVENKKAARNYKGKKKDQYKSFKLEGIMESPVNLCVTCDSTRGGKHILGRNTIKETDVYSTCGAVQNLWLAARAEGIGVGWVSIINNKKLKKILDIPNHIKPVAYMCLGYVSKFAKKPILEMAGWRKRIPLDEVISWNKLNGNGSK